MTKQQPATNPPLWEQIDQHPAVIWFAENGGNILYGLAATILILMLLFRFGWIGSSASAADYANITTEYNTFARSPTSESGKEAFVNLKSLLKKHPQLQAKYDGLIAQELIIVHDPEQATPFLKKSLSRTTDGKLPHYADFARTTLLISEKKYEEALNKSLILNEQLTGNQDTLYAYNLLRIVTLQQKLGQHEAKIKTWKQWGNLAKNNPLFQKIEKIFAEGHIGLDNYMQRTKL